MHLLVLYPRGRVGLHFGYRSSQLSAQLRNVLSMYMWLPPRGWAEEWSLGCVNPTSWLPLAARREFTQPTDHSFAQSCIYMFVWMYDQCTVCVSVSMSILICNGRQSSGDISGLGFVSIAPIVPKTVKLENSC